MARPHFIALPLATLLKIFFSWNYDLDIGSDFCGRKYFDNTKAVLTILSRFNINNVLILSF